jgi:Arc/MetJ-type ribon-helix-helix transcriptional regulator
MQLISVRLPKSLINRVDKKAKMGKMNRSEFIRSILETVVREPVGAQPDRLTEVRDELLLAVGQLGDSLRQLPKFMRRGDLNIGDAGAETEASSLAANASSTRIKRPSPESEKPSSETKSPSFSNSLNVDSAEVSRMSDRGANVSTSESRIEAKAPDTKVKTGGRQGRSSGSNLHETERSEMGTTIGWSSLQNVKPELKLRPRQESVDYVSEIVKDNDLTELMRNKMTPPEILEVEIVQSDVSSVGSNVGRRERRGGSRGGQLEGRPIGEERRQSIRLARVLAYKAWDAQRLAERFRMPVESIEHAIEGRKDLASLKVEALLSTWEEEMQYVGWKPEAQ